MISTWLRKKHLPSASTDFQNRPDLPAPAMRRYHIQLLYVLLLTGFARQLTELVVGVGNRSRRAAVQRGGLGQKPAARIVSEGRLFRVGRGRRRDLVRLMARQNVAHEVVLRAVTADPAKMVPLRRLDQSTPVVVIERPFDVEGSSVDRRAVQNSDLLASLQAPGAGVDIGEGYDPGDRYEVEVSRHRRSYGDRNGRGVDRTVGGCVGLASVIGNSLKGYILRGRLIWPRGRAR